MFLNLALRWCYCLCIQEECKGEFAQLTKERAQQASLALEDAELQKTAVTAEAENKVKEIQQELEAARTVSGGTSLLLKSIN